MYLYITALASHFPRRQDSILVIQNVRKRNLAKIAYVCLVYKSYLYRNAFRCSEKKSKLQLFLIYNNKLVLLLVVLVLRESQRFIDSTTVDKSIMPSFEPCRVSTNNCGCLWHYVVFGFGTSLLRVAWSSIRCNVNLLVVELYRALQVVI